MSLHIAAHVTFKRPNHIGNHSPFAASGRWNTVGLRMCSFHFHLLSVLKYILRRVCDVVVHESKSFWYFISYIENRISCTTDVVHIRHCQVSYRFDLAGRFAFRPYFVTCWISREESHAAMPLAGNNLSLSLSFSFPRLVASARRG